MPQQVTIDGIPSTIEKLADGTIRVVQESRQINAMHGSGTGGEVSYIVHPVQQQQYEHLSGLLSPAERARPPEGSGARPWWSYVPAEKERHREKDEGA
jgi:hypothetical protein